jgi:plasmid stabilization system protein ParE
LAEVRFSLAALADLDEIVEYIAHDSPDAAERFVGRLRTATGRLRDFPQMGRIVPERSDPDLREVLFRDYRIVYKTHGPIVGVVAVVHGARGIRRVLAERPFDLDTSE